MLRKVLKNFIYFKILPYLGLLIAKIIYPTYRIRIVNPEIELNVLKKEESPIYITWHQRLFPLFVLFATRRPISVMISQSKDGEFIARIVNMLGWHPVRGSSSRGGREALKEICTLANKGYKIGHVVDGPRGPFGIVKPGLLRIAQHSGMPILPTIMSAERKWVFNSWDKFIVPKPFSRVIIRFGDEVYVPKNLQSSAFEEKRLSIERTLKKLYIETDCLWENPEKIDQVS